MEKPINILEPNATSSYLLDNRDTMGAGPYPLQFALKGLFALNEDPDLETRNEVELSVGVELSEVFAVIMPKLDSRSLMEFALGDIGNIDCLLAALASPLFDDDNNPVANRDRLVSQFSGFDHSFDALQRILQQLHKSTIKRSP